MFTVVILLGLSVTHTAAAWLEVSTHHRVNPAAVVAVEIRAETGVKEATIRTQSGEHLVQNASVLQEIETLVADTASWFTARRGWTGRRTFPWDASGAAIGRPSALTRREPALTVVG